jgi:CheY-like chemotaxis protein
LPLIGEDVELETRLREDAGAIAADRGQIEQVVMNLVVNARDAMPQGGTLTLETARVQVDAPHAVTTGELAPGRYVALVVADTGGGMTEETLARIFDPFFTTKPEGRGTGLGLSTVYGVVKQAGGAIAVRSAPGKGTRFTLYFPRVEARAAAPATAAPRRAAGARQGTILVVEDQHDLRRAVIDVLVDAGYQVLDAAGPHEALQLVGRREGAIDLLLTDVVMPKMGGHELAQEIRRTRPEIKIVFMTGYAPDRGFRDGAEGGVFAMLPKPFTPERLVEKIDEVMGEPAGRRDGEGSQPP